MLLLTVIGHIAGGKVDMVDLAIILQLVSGDPLPSRRLAFWREKQLNRSHLERIVHASSHQIIRYIAGAGIIMDSFGDGNTVDSLVPTATSNGGGTISANTMKLRTQYAKKTAATQ